MKHTDKRTDKRTWEVQLVEGPPCPSLWEQGTGNVPLIHGIGMRRILQILQKGRFESMGRF